MIEELPLNCQKGTGSLSHGDLRHFSSELQQIPTCEFPIPEPNNTFIKINKHVHVLASHLLPKVQNSYHSIAYFMQL